MAVMAEALVRRRPVIYSPDTPVPQVALSYLLGQRDHVRQAFAEDGVPESLRGERLVVKCRKLRYLSELAADELVRLAIVERGAYEVALIGCAPELVERIKAVAERRGLTNAVAARKALEVGL